MRKALIILFFPFSVTALNCGTQGAVYPIKEKSALALIEERLNQMQAKGEIEAHQQRDRKSVV